MTKNSNKFITLSLFFVLFSFPSYAQWARQNASIMGTNIYVEVWHEDEAVRQKGVELVLQEMERINQLMSPYIETSELSKINLLASDSPVVISDEMFTLISFAQYISKITKGSFDITYASVGYLYDFREKQRPDKDKIDSLLSAINYKHIQLDDINSTIRFLHPKVKIDLGGIAKGHAVDNAIDLLAELGVEHALVTAGGDTRLLGDKLGRDWKVGITDPRDKSKQAVLIPLSNIAMSTSGDYERYFDDNGVRYHHIISPSNGDSVREVQSVSIIGPKSVMNDGLSTAVFVMGLANGIGLINSLPEYEVIVMDKDRKLHYSNGLLQ